MQAAHHQCEYSANLVTPGYCNRPCCLFASSVFKQDYYDGQYAYNPGLAIDPDERGSSVLPEHTSCLWSPLLPVERTQHLFFGPGFDEYVRNVTLQDAEAILETMAATEAQESPHGMMADEAELVEQRRLANQYVPESKVTYDMPIPSLRLV